MMQALQSEIAEALSVSPADVEMDSPEAFGVYAKVKGQWYRVQWSEEDAIEETVNILKGVYTQDPDPEVGELKGQELEDFCNEMAEDWPEKLSQDGNIQTLPSGGLLFVPTFTPDDEGN